MHVPDAVVETDTPNTFIKWIRQQFRWMRGTMIETSTYPAMVGRMFPWVIYNIGRTRVLPLVTFAAVVQTAFTGQLPAWVGSGSHLVKDWGLSAVMGMLYLIIARPNGVGARWSDLGWALPSLIWVLFWFPAIVVWALLTVFDASWGTSMRAVGEVAQQGGARPRAGVLERLQQLPLDLCFMTAWTVMVMVALAQLSNLGLVVWMDCSCRITGPFNGLLCWGI